MRYYDRFFEAMDVVPVNCGYCQYMKTYKKGFSDIYMKCSEGFIERGNNGWKHPVSEEDEKRMKAEEQIFYMPKAWLTAEACPEFKSGRDECSG
jgi:hypothetical protein